MPVPFLNGLTGAIPDGHGHKTQLAPSARASDEPVRCVFVPDRAAARHAGEARHAPRETARAVAPLKPPPPPSETSGESG